MYLGKAFILSFIIMIITTFDFIFLNVTWSEYEELRYIVALGFPILSLNIYTYLIYKIIKKPRKMKVNNDKKIILIIKQIFNGIALSFFIKIILNRTWLIDIYFYGDFPMDIIYYDINYVLLDRTILSIILIIECIALVLLNKNINEYLKLITYSQFIIIPIIFFTTFYAVYLTPPSYEYIDYLRGVKYDILEYVIRILNISLPLIFCLKLSKKNNNKKIIFN